MRYLSPPANWLSLLALRRESLQRAAVKSGPLGNSVASAMSIVREI